MTSDYWLYALVTAAVVGAVAAGFTAFSNIKYQQAREIERDQRATEREAEVRRRLAIEARTVLAAEVRENIELIDEVFPLLEMSGTVPFRSFQVSAWQVVSGGELVRGFEARELSQVAGAYQLVFKANETLDRLTDLTIDIASLNTAAPGYRDTVTANLKVLLARMREELNAVTEVITAPT